MADDKCIINPERDCLGILRSKELEKDLGDIEKDLNDLRRQNSSSHERIFDRLQALETQQSIQKEKCQYSQEKLSTAGSDIGNVQKELKEVAGKVDRLTHQVENNSRMNGEIVELQTDYKSLHRDFMTMGFRVEALEHVATDVNEIKEKPAKKWEDTTGKIMWAVIAAIVALVLTKIGLT